MFPTAVYIPLSNTPPSPITFISEKLISTGSCRNFKNQIRFFLMFVIFFIFIFLMDVHNRDSAQPGVLRGGGGK